MTKGCDIDLNILPLKQGLNKLVFRQMREKDADELFTLVLNRKGDLPLDLQFCLDPS